MKLNNLPKDMLVELVSNIREDVEKEHCHYIVVHSDNDYDMNFGEFWRTKVLKEFLLEYLCYSVNREIVFDKDSEILKFLTSENYLYSEYLKYIHSLENRYSLEDLLEIVIKVEKARPNYDGKWRIHRIIKGKLLFNYEIQ